MRKLGDYENEDLQVGKFDPINSKYERGTRLRNNPSSYLSRDDEEGPTYYLSSRLERVALEFAERIDMDL